MNKKLIASLILLPAAALANDSTGFVSTGGVEYIKNDNIAMVSEDLFLSKKQVRVIYQYQNLTDKPISETILFPLPIVDSEYDYDFADVSGLLKSFKIFANGKAIKPTMNVRAFMYAKTADGYDSTKPIDVTETFKKCGLSDKEIISNWTKQVHFESVAAKLSNCHEKQLEELKPTDASQNVFWSSQIIYSWQQTFAPNKVTEIKHQYRPLVGGGLDVKSLAKDPETGLAKDYCLAPQTAERLPEQTSFDQMGYILKTGANWAKPIQNFKLTIAREKDEAVLFCWNGNASKKEPKGNQVLFEIQQQDFIPNQDLDLLFVPTK